MASNSSSPCDNLNRGMAFQGSGPFEDSRKQQVVDNNTQTYRSVIQPGSTPPKMVALSENEASTKASTKANIDPRIAAAELKKKLLKDKSVLERRGNSLGPPGEVSHNTVWPEKCSSSDTAADSAFIPHALPQMPTQDSVTANVEDIAALIKSISSTSQDNQGRTTEETTDPKVSGGCVITAVVKAGASPSTSVQKIPELDRVPHNPSGKAKQSIKPSHIPPQAKGGAAAVDGNFPGVGNTPARSINVQTTATRTDEPKTNNGRTNISTPSTTEAKRSTLRCDTSVSSSAARLHDKTLQVGAINNDAGSTVSGDAYSPSSNLGRLNEAKNGNVSTINEQPNSTGQARDISNGGSTQTVGATLAQLINQDQDLRDWLLYTQYFDVEARNKKLTRYRKLAEMEAEEQRIKEERERLAAARRKLLEEDDLDRGFLPHVARSRHSQTPQPFTPATPITDVSSTKPSMANPFNVLGKDAPTIKVPAIMKRGLDCDDTQKPRSKMPKLDTEVAQDSKAFRADDIDELTDRERGRNNNRDYESAYRHRSRSFLRGASPRRHSPFRAPFDQYERYNNDYSYGRRDSYHHDTDRYDAYRGKGKRGDWGRTSPNGRYGRRPDMDPKPVDLGDESESRFFVVKSFNEDNVRMCMEDGLWVTQTQNTDTLTSAFAQCKNVILFFSINKSRAFQGYARMATAPSPDTPRPRWIKNIHWETSPPFRVEWLSTTDVEFRLIGHLLNPLNNNLPVLVGKDGQEIEEECGRKLLEEMERVARSKNEHLFRNRGPPESPRANRGRGGFNMRGRGAKYAKHEER